MVSSSIISNDLGVTSVKGGAKEKQLVSQDECTWIARPARVIIIIVTVAATIAISEIRLRGKWGSLTKFRRSALSSSATRSARHLGRQCRGGSVKA